MIFKIAALKNFAITVKKTPALECLFHKYPCPQACIFIKRRLQHRCFLKKFLRTAFFVEHLTVHYTFSKFYVMIEFFGRLWVQNWHFSYFLCHCFDFVHGCFHTKIFSKCKFRTHCNLGTTLIESLKFRNNSRIAVSSPSNLLRKLWLWVYLILYCYYFSLEVVLQGMA